MGSKTSNQKSPPYPPLLRFPQPRNAHQEAAQIGQWILDDLRELIAKIADAKEKEIPQVGKLLARLTRVCHLGKKADHTKLKALAKEILNDWDAVVAFVKNPLVTTHQ